MKIQTLDHYILMKIILGSSELDCMVVVIMMLVMVTMVMMVTIGMMVLWS